MNGALFPTPLECERCGGTQPKAWRARAWTCVECAFKPESKRYEETTMVRRLECVECAKRWRKTAGFEPDETGAGPTKWPGEFMRLVVGTIRDTFYICDACNARLVQGELAVAVSIYTAEKPYFPWEHNYVAQTPPAI